MSAPSRHHSEEACVLERHDFRLVLDPSFGGRIVSLDWRGLPLLHPGAAGTWPASDAGGSFPLVPYSNRIRNARFRLAGEVQTLTEPAFQLPHALHGQGWLKPWSIMARTADSITLRLIMDPPEGGWRWAYGVEQTFTLAPDGFSMRLALESRSATPMPAGMGFHPFFPRTSDLELAFDATGVWQTDQPGLPVREDPIPSRWAFSTPRPLGGVTLDHCFSGWNGQARLTWPRRGLSLAIAADTPLRHLVVFVPIGEDYICVEPVSHANDPFNPPAAGPASGLSMLAPGARVEAGMRLVPEALAQRTIRVDP